MFKKTRISRALMLAFGGSVVLGALPSLAQPQRVEITGSSIKRVEAEGALQVQTLTKTDIERTGVQTTEQLLQTVSAISLVGANAALSTVSDCDLWCVRRVAAWPGRRAHAGAGQRPAARRRSPAAAAAHRSTSTAFRWLRSTVSRS